MNDSTLFIACDGSPRERGLTHGAAAKAQIQANLETYRQLFEAQFSLPWADVRHRIAPFVASLEAFDAGLLAELDGIAEGAGRDLLDLVVLNARSSITMTRSEGECTSLAYLPALGEPAPVLLGQNWDNLARLEKVVLRITEPGRPDILTLTEAGTLAKIGLNSAGVGVCVNGLRTPGAPERGVPIFAMLRRVLQSTSLGEAMAVVTTARREAPHNFLFASAEGGAFTIETTPTEFDVLPPEGRFLAHTNHFVSQRLRVRDVGKTKTPHSVVRLWRVQRLLDGYRGEFGLADLKAVLSDHFDAPNSICKHPLDQSAFVVETKCAVLLELAAGRMHVSRGQPCAGQYTTFEFARPAVPA